MEISSSAQPAAAAEPATMFVALELSKSSWLVALHSPVADKISQHPRRRRYRGSAGADRAQAGASGGKAEPNDPYFVLLRGGL